MVNVSKSFNFTGNQTAKFLPIIWLFFIISISVVTYLYISSGAFADRFIKPLKKQFDDFSPTFTPTLTPVPTLISTPSSTLVPTLKAKVTSKPQKTVVSCIQKNIPSGEFASNKCYSKADFNNLDRYLQEYNLAVFHLDAAQSSIRITCNCRTPRECEFFKDSCAEDQREKSQAESDINKYRSAIQSIIARGR